MNVKLPKLEIWQKEILDYYLENPSDKWIIIKAIRQCGKSILCQILLVAASLKHKNSVSLSISPVMSQSRKMFNDVCSFAAPIIKRINASLLEIKFVNGSIIKFRSGEQFDSIRGETCRHTGILVVDEAAYLKDELFYSILVPTTNVFKNNIIIASTPKFKRGFYYDLYLTGLDKESKVKSFDWTVYDTSKYLSKDTLEIYRKQMPRTSFNSEFLGEWIDGEGTVFTDFKKCVGNVTLDNEQELYVTIDWACGGGGNSDDTVITFGQCIEVNGIKKIGIRNQYAFNDKTPVNTCCFIVDKIRRCIEEEKFREITVICEKNSIGNVYYSMLVTMLDDYEKLFNENVSYFKEIEINVHTFLTTNDSKKRIVERLSTLFEQDRIVIPNDEKLLLELSLFEARANSNGTILYGVQTSEHDDRVMSICFLVDANWKEIDII